VNLLFLIGDQAVGKMTVGQELAKITGLRLFHNHMTIEPVYALFGDKNRHWKTIRRLRQVFFEDFAESGMYGMIYTKRVNFASERSVADMTSIADIFTKQGAQIYCAELFAPLDIRLARNTTENRYAHKPSKRLDYQESVDSMMDEAVRCESRPGEMPFENHIKIDNTDLPSDAVARMIKERFGFV